MFWTTWELLKVNRSILKVLRLRTPGLVFLKVVLKDGKIAPPMPGELGVRVTAEV